MNIQTFQDIIVKVIQTTNNTTCRKAYMELYGASKWSMEIKIYAKDSTYEDQFLANFSTSFSYFIKLY